jgi:hypothetical protein
MEASQIALIVVAGFFGTYLVLQVRPLLSSKRRGLLSEVRTARKRAADATTPEDRSRALVEAGEVSARARRWTSAAGLFLRALRVSPDSAEVVDRAAKALAPRPRLVRLLFERRLAALTREGATGSAYVATLRTLAELYRSSSRTRHLADVLERLASHEEPRIATEDS